MSFSYLCFSLFQEQNESFHALEDIVSDGLIRTAYMSKNAPVNTPDTCIPSNVNDDFIFWP